MQAVGRRTSASPFEVAGARVRYDADRDAWLVHRPERRWPRPSGSGPVAVPAVPEVPDSDGAGAWTTYLPMLGSLGVVAFAFVVRSLVYFVVAGFMVVALVGGAIAVRVVSSRRTKARRRRVRADWSRRLAAAEVEAGRAAQRQRDALLGLYPDTDGLLALVRDHQAVWERRPHHADFAHVRLGLGAVPADVPLVVDSGSEAPGAVLEVDLAAAATAAATAGAVVTDAPVVVPLRALSAVACVGDRASTRALAGSWIASLAATCAPTDLRVVLSADPEALPEWDWAKWLPHLRDPMSGDGFGRALRAVVTEPSALSTVVRGIVEPRLEQRRRAQESGWSSGGGPASVAGEHVVIVIDGYDPLTLSRDVHLHTALEQGAELAVTVVLLVDDAARVPSRCGAEVVLLVDGTARYREAGPHAAVTDGVRFDRVDVEAAERLARTLAPLQLADADAAADLVDVVRLTELLGHESVDALDPVTEWLTVDMLTPVEDDDDSDPEVRRRGVDDLLATPIGVRSDGGVLTLDLKEAAAGGMGPHGVLVGATGSGKSELLRALVTGLATRHSPELVNVVLVDFKGGLAFADLEELPHTAGVITNLADDLSRAERMRVSLDGERDRRQQLLREAGVSSIRDYHQRVIDGADLEPLPYLVIVVDEFGELLEARPEFLDTFVAIGRLGRSLGMHLLLATQRLDEGRIRGLESHLRYRLCLRTYTPLESAAVLGVPDAHQLPPLPGLGYLRVDTELLRFKAANPSLPPQPVRRAGPAPAAIRPFRLAAEELEPGADPVVVPAASQESTELAAIVTRLAAVGGRARQVWLPELPTHLELVDVEIPDVEPERLLLALGVLDDPARQTQGPLVLDLGGAGGHVACVGGPRTGKTTFLRSLTAALTAFRSPGDVSLYALDLSGGGLHDLAGIPHIGAVASRHDPEAIARVLREIAAIVEERAAAFRALDVTNLVQLRAHPRASELLPHPLAGDVFLLVDGIGLLRSEFPELDLAIADLAATSLQFGVHVVVTANRWLDVRPALLDAVGTRLELHVNDPVDSIAGRGLAAALPEIAGRGLLRDGRQFQLALPPRLEAADASREWPGTLAAKVIPLPRRVHECQVTELATAAGRRFGSVTGFVLGIAEFRLAPIPFDPVARGQHLLVYGDGGSGRTTLLNRIVKHLVGLPADEVRLHIVDLGRTLLDVADDPRVEHYAFTASLADQLSKDLLGTLYDRLPPPDLTRRQLMNRDWWRGPEHVLVVDDYDMVAGGAVSPLAPLTEALGHAADVGFHVVLARPVAGAARSSYETFGQRLREGTLTGLLLSGDRTEGPLIGDRPAQAQPPGRGLLIRRGQPDTLLQLLLPDEEMR